MTITVTRSGGFAGSSETLASVDTTRMDAGTAQRIEELIKKIRFFGLPATVSGRAVGADFLRYEVQIRDSDRQHHVAFVDDDGPETAGRREPVISVTG